MRAFASLHRRILLLFIITLVSLIVHGSFSMDSMLSEQSRTQQKNLSPAIDLITEHLTRPLHISQTIAKSDDVRQMLLDPDFDKQLKINYLNKLESQFGMDFFLASDSAKVQINSDGSSLDLVEGEVNWYFKYKQLDDIVNADIGKWDDIHFYIDVKVFNENNEFLGFVGTSKRLKSFLETFETFRTNHGFEFFFVNATGEIMLASDPNLNPYQRQFQRIQEQDWYKQAIGTLVFGAQNTPAPLDNQLVSVEESEYLISQFSVKNFDWELYLIAPVMFNPSPFNLAYLSLSVLIVVVISVIFLGIYQSVSRLADASNVTKVNTPSGFLCSDELIKSIIQYSTFKRPAHVAMLRVAQIGHFPATHEELVEQIEISSAISNTLLNILANNDERIMVGKSHQNQWMFLFQETTYVEMNKYMKDIRHGLETLQLDVKKQSFSLEYQLSEIDLENETELSEVLFEFEQRFKHKH
ncbi:cache domain-containing protein [Glaciecola sp. KUL10]|jgi:hypothetical protein|uniref:cache domain-containing protein n=1 Tax=Glaciecola sp. (strain KUL10) TaxID=2161813 RepID=UPI0011B4F4D7|nr:cache domain-containing protein [Glaciecola sp. KUL10]